MVLCILLLATQIANNVSLYEDTLFCLILVLDLILSVCFLFMAACYCLSISTTVLPVKIMLLSHSVHISQIHMYISELMQGQKN